MRIIASLLLHRNCVIQTYGFHDCSIIGSPITTTKHLEEWGIDEFLLIQKDSSFAHLLQNLKAIISATSTPITVCGGLDSIDKCRQLIQSGADRICIQSLLFNNIDAVKHLSKTYGGQSITVKFDINPIEKRLRSLNQMPYEKFSDLFLQLKKILIEYDIKDLLFYDTNADGNENVPDFSLIDRLDLAPFSLILGGGLNRSNCREIYKMFKNSANDLSLSFSNCLYQHEMESSNIVNVLGESFSQHRLYRES